LKGKKNQNIDINGIGRKKTLIGTKDYNYYYIYLGNRIGNYGRCAM
jgi:hypothetical protein